MSEANKKAVEKLWRRPVCLGLALVVCGAVLVPSACAVPFEPASKIKGLRVVGVETDKPYAAPGERVSFDLAWSRDREWEAVGAPQITWIGGCVNPVGDQYYGCYEQFARIYEDFQQTGSFPKDVAQGLGRTHFEWELPKDILEERKSQTRDGPVYGTALLFFMVCDGTVRPIDPEGTGAAGSFPLGCFDSEGTRLGADAFVPGYTQVYVFEDERTNGAPQIDSLVLDDKELPEQEADWPIVAPCTVSEEERRAPATCTKQDPFEACQAVTLSVRTPKDVAELDPTAKDEKGNPQHETVWVNYFVDGGDLDKGIKLIVDAQGDVIDDPSVKWIPPPASAIVTFYANVRDSRGGSSIIKRRIRVQ